MMMRKNASNSKLTAAHFVPSDILQPYNPVMVNLIGAGGTGGQVLTALARMNHALIALGHAGLWVRVYDDDKVEPANLGRQLFTTAEFGEYKAVALINRVNRFFGTNWKAETIRFGNDMNGSTAETAATISISCVDTVTARFQIAKVLTAHTHGYYGRNRALYWMDFGNSRSTGQVLLSTLDKVKQPVRDDFRTVEKLPLVTQEFEALLKEADQQDNSPSCSMAEALAKQDLFINSALANCGASLLWQLFREGVLLNRGFFLNLGNFIAQPIRVS